MNIDSNQTHTFTNQLIHEKSPYLLQHAHNPVNWYPWSDEAFRKAHTENKPIFLSIGYSTCHWCHVMERESFEDEEVAEILNEHYVSIKVDREERPDIDSIYMTYCQATGGHGGWPLTVFLTPDRIPFYVGTYFPKKSRYGVVGIIDLIQNIQKKWKKSPGGFLSYAAQISGSLQELYHKTTFEGIQTETVHEAFHALSNRFDATYGGFGRAPKFPTPHNLLFLLRYYIAYNEEKALQMVEKTLEQMFRGGIFDHLGGGFSRYSTDAKWLVPHFEKMLYDNALLLLTYTECYQITHKAVYKTVVEQITAYIFRDMTSEEGGFYCAEDADSEGEEGKFYLWTVDEMKELLDQKEVKGISEVYGVTERGNFEGKNILNRIESDLEAHPELQVALQKLFDHRKLRIAPHKDDKILTGWNGLMIVGLAESSRVFENQNYLEHAVKAFEFIENHLKDENGRYYARYRDGEKKHLAYLEDYACLCLAATSLYEATYDLKYLTKAIHLTKMTEELFLDDDGKGFFLYGKDGEELFLRPKEIYDGAIPSGNSVMIYNLLRLSRFTGDSCYEELANKIMNYFGDEVNQNPMMHTFFLCSLFFQGGKGREVVFAGDRKDEILQRMMKWPSKHYSPFTITLYNNESEALKKINSFAASQLPKGGQATAYVCEGMSCKQPVTGTDELNW